MIDCPNCKSARNTSGLVVLNNRIFVDCFNCGYREEYVAKQTKLPAQEGEKFSSYRFSICPNCKKRVEWGDHTHGTFPCPHCGHDITDTSAFTDYGTCPNCHHNIIWEHSIDGNVKRCPNCKYIHGEEVVVPKQRLFPSGAVRVDDNTPAYTLMPPCAIRRLANVYKVGEVNYPNRNWRKGIPVTNIVDHALEHLMKWLEGSRTEDHLAKVAWAMFSLMYYESVDKLEDDVKWAASLKH